MTWILNVIFMTISAPRRSRCLGIKTEMPLKSLVKTAKKAILTTLRFIVGNTWLIRYLNNGHAVRVEKAV